VIGCYTPGTGWLHRLPAGWKLLGLAVLATVLVAVRHPATVAGAVVAVLAVTVAARIPIGILLAQVRPLRWVVAVLVPFQVWTTGWENAVVIVGTLVVTVAAAGLVSTTTRVSEMLDVLGRALRPLRRLGVDPDRVSLLLALAIRAVPVLTETAQQVNAARRARGLERSPRALLVPFVIRSIRHAHQLGEALAARGVDDT